MKEFLKNKKKPIGNITKVSFSFFFNINVFNKNTVTLLKVLHKFNQKKIKVRDSFTVPSRVVQSY